MSKIYFKAGAPLKAHSPVYLQREADQKAITYLNQMEYVSIIEPRQQGKTSLIYQLMGHFTPQGYVFAMLDLMAGKPLTHSEAEWYTALGKLLALQLLPFIPINQHQTLPKDGTTWEEFLSEIANCAVSVNKPIVIVLDEIGAMPKKWATHFFSVLRSIYTLRQTIPRWQYLTFIIAGAFNPKDLIEDRAVSNFNIDQRVPLHDFTQDQLKQLVAHLCLSKDITEAIVARIYYWTSGQPYLSQWLCAALEDQRELTCANANECIDNAARQFFNSDTHYLERIKSLYTEPELLAYTYSITARSTIKLSTALNDKHFYLTHVLGVIKADHHGRCQIRNRVCEQALVDMQSEYIGYDGTRTDTSLRKRAVSKTLGPTRTFQIFFSYAHEDELWLRKIEKHLRTLEHQGLITIWYDRDISAGQDWENEIDKYLSQSHLVLLLISSDFIASNYCFSIEVEQSLKRHISGEAHVIPIILRPVEWTRTPFGHLHALPSNGEAVTKWLNEDEALVDIVRGIQKVLEKWDHL